MGIVIHSPDEIKEYFVQIGRSLERDEIECIEQIMLLLISAIDLIVKENEGSHDDVSESSYSSYVKEFNLEEQSREYKSI